MRKFILSIVIAMLAMPTFAQERASSSSKFGDNLFLQLQIGPTFSLSEGYSDASIGDIVTPHLAISAGKYFSPIIGGRLQIGGWSAKHYDAPIKETFKTKYIQANADALLNLINIFSAYEEDRQFNFIGFVGFGYVHGFKDTKNGMTTTNMIAPRLGLQVDYTLNEKVSLNLEAVGNLMRDDFNGFKSGVSYDATVNILAGVSFKL